MPDNPESCRERSCIFMECLYKEKNIHKNHRFSLVQRKLLFIGALFGVGSISLFNDKGVNFSSIVLLVPFIALAYDIFIFAEDFKVKRIGLFIRTLCINTCRDEKDWEIFVNRNRETMARHGTTLLTFLSFAMAAIFLYFGNNYSRVVSLQ
jgi:hypothetical protein